ncbi:MAG: hypothetical protein M1817_005138 [Caeruleum heppii]|nr:MAG: hypothetical protein M1817_005138 [Caeruleum heppii]
MSGSSHSGGFPGSGDTTTTTSSSSSSSSPPNAHGPSHAELLFSALTPLQAQAQAWSVDNPPPGYTGVVEASSVYPSSDAENEPPLHPHGGTSNMSSMQAHSSANLQNYHSHLGPASAFASHAATSMSTDPFEYSTYQTGILLPHSYAADIDLASEPTYADLVSNGLLAMEAYDPAEMVDLDGFQLEDFERNLDFIRFVEQWYYRSRAPHGGYPHLPNRAAEVRNWARPTQVMRKELNGDRYDVQGINWAKIGIMRSTARRVRRELYGNYTSLNTRGFDFTGVKFLQNTTNYAMFRRLDTKNIGQLVHFQLRNLLCCTSKSDVYYARKDEIFVTDPTTDETRIVLDLTKPSLATVAPGGWKTSTLSANHGVLIAGGFGGEYAMTSLIASWGSEHVEDHVTRDNNGITNYVHTYLDRTNAHPQAVFCSNDRKLRVLDCQTNTFVKEHEYEWPVNCAASSPDGRLRVLVGDTMSIILADAETGETLEKLKGHRDYGFACAWSENGIHVATGNQDRQVRIYDARNWCRPLTVFATEMAAPRSLHFSPLGGGHPLLTVAESADNVHVVDARTFDEMQTLDHFGEIAGVSFTPDGSEFFVANTDPSFGGILEYERASFDVVGGKQRTMRTHRRANTAQGVQDFHGSLYREAGAAASDSRNGGTTDRRRRGRVLSNVVW